MATYAPPKPTLTLEPRLPNQDVYEVRIYDSRCNRHLVPAIEIVSPSNKDRPENRATFVAKTATLLKNNICVSIVDVVNTYDFNLYAELMNFLKGVDPALGSEPPPMYAATLRLRYEDRRRRMDNWYHPLAIGQPLPTLPIEIAQRSCPMPHHCATRLFHRSPARVPCNWACSSGAGTLDLSIYRPGTSHDDQFFRRAPPGHRRTWRGTCVPR